MLTEEEKNRYQRQFLIHDWGLEKQELLKRTTVFVAGAGGSGSPILTQLALLGIGCIRLCDYDAVETSNLNRQFIHGVSEDSRVGMNKAVSARKTIRNLNPYVRVEIFKEKITEENIHHMVGDSAMIFDSVDAFETKFVLSACAVRKQIPHLFYGMIDVNAFVSIFIPPRTPCFHCLFDEKKVMKYKMARQLFQGVDGDGTPVCCPPVFVSAGFAMTEALKLLLNIGEPAYNKFFFFLQKADATISRTKAWQGVMYWASDFFRRTAKNQGFDLMNVGRRRIVEELIVPRNKVCSLCGG